MKKMLLAIVFAASFAKSSGAEVVTKSGTFAGLKVNYKVVLPNGYDPARAYPTVLAFAGSSQDMSLVDLTLRENWTAEAERRGYVVVTPEAPGGRLFFEDGAAIFPAFLDQILKDYKVQGGKLHLAGRSNGGLSAFLIASSYPKYFVSLTGFPGLLDQPTDARLEALRPLCIHMYVGERDSGWRQAMQDQYETLRKKGFRITFSVEPKQPHLIQTLAGDGAKRLFDNFENVATCK